MIHQPGKHALSWVSLGLLVLLCGLLGFLQYRWIGAIAQAERERLRADLNSRLIAMNAALNAAISADCRSLVASSDAIREVGRVPALEAAWAAQRVAHGDEFTRVALAIENGGHPDLLALNFQTDKYTAADWPAGWEDIQRQLAERPGGRGPMPEPGRGPRLFPVPGLFRIPVPGPPGSRAVLLLELNRDYARVTLLPGMLTRYAGANALNDYDFEVLDRTEPPAIVFRSGNRIGDGPADAEIALLNGVSGEPFASEGRGPGGPPPGRADRRPPENGPRGDGPQRMPPDEGGAGPGMAPFDSGRWLLRARYRAGSLDVLVAQTRRRNLAVSGVLLLMILAAAGALVRFTRRAQHLADLEMNFVAGISHELRTPLTVIRTAAYNLRGERVATQPERVAKYGELIARESGKLEALLAQVLQFAGARAGQAIRERVRVPAAEVMDEIVREARAALEGTGIELETGIGEKLPDVVVDRQAFTAAIGNLIDNARKYGAGDNHWIGIAANEVRADAGNSLEIRVTDRGPGIPTDEQPRIFEAFVRGRNAVGGQIRGTGLGLSLVKTIVTELGGSVGVKSEPGRGTEFTVRVPAA